LKRHDPDEQEVRVDSNVDEVREEIRRRQREAAEGRREQERANGEQARRIREVVREAAEMLKGDVPGGKNNG
jgi:hypothetical protein